MGASRAEDTLAIDIYHRAEESGEEIALGTVERRLSELLAHEPGAAGCVPPRHPFGSRASGMSRARAGGIAATRRRARR